MASEATPEETLPLALVRYDVSTSAVEPLEEVEKTRDAIESAFGAYKGITFDTPDNYEKGRRAIAHMRSTRTGVDKRRKVLNEDALAWQRRVNAKAKEITSLIAEIEDPLQAAKDTVDRSAEDARRAAEDAERAKIRAEQETKLAAERAEFEEKQRLAAEENVKLDEARRAFEAERAEFERQKAEVAASAGPAPTANLSREPPMFSEADEVQVFGGAAPPPANTSAQPSTDAEFVAAYAAQIRALRAPEVSSLVAAAIVEQAQALLAEAARDLEAFVKTPEAAATAAE